MNIRGINTDYRTSFGQLIYNPPQGMKLTRLMQQAMNEATEDLKDTKHWDLVIEPDSFGRLTGKYVNKRDSNQVYSSGFNTFKVKDNVLSTDSYYIKKAEDGYEEAYISFVDLVFDTKEQVKTWLDKLGSLKYDKPYFHPYTKVELAYDKEVVKLLDSAKEIVFDDEVHLLQTNA